MTKDVGVTGIGGIFLKARDPETLATWYRDHLGLVEGATGNVVFGWRDFYSAKREGATIWSLFAEASDYFAPSDARVMVNYRTDDLDGLLARLQAGGVPPEGEIQAFDFGRFAWVLDPEGNKIELWEPPGGPVSSIVSVPATTAPAGGPFLGARPTLGVRDVPRALAFYLDVLGFAVHATLGDEDGAPPHFALLERDAASLALVRADPPAVASFAAVYLEVADARAVHDRCVTAGAPIDQPLTDHPWHMTDFVVIDPDGHRVAIGQRTPT